MLFIFFFVFIIILVMMIFTYTKQRLLYHPSKEYVTTCEQIAQNLKLDPRCANQFNIKQDKTQITGWYFVPKEEYPTVLFSHGNSGNISNRQQMIGMLINLGLNVCIYDYNGYGMSTGYPNEKNLYKNGETALKYLINDNHISPDRIIILGESIGCGVASYLAQKYSCPKLILLSGMSSIKNIFYQLVSTRASFLSFFGYFINEFPTHQYLSKYKGKVLILHSKTDDIIDYQHALDNAKVCNECQVVEIGGTHNFPDINSQHVAQIHNFIVT